MSIVTFSLKAQQKEKIIELDEVVSLLESVKRVKVDAYGNDKTKDLHDQPCRALGTNNSTATPAIKLRKQDNCQPVSVAAFIATPPVEKSTPPMTTLRRSLNTDLLHQNNFI